MRHTAVAVISTFGLLLAAPASAQYAPAGAPELARDPTVHRHFGFYIRPDIGIGFGRTSASDSGTSVEMSGGGAHLGVAIGGAVTENVIIAGHLYGFAVSNPSLKVNGTTYSTSSTDASMSAIGPQLTYYFMPANVFVSATVALTRLSLKTNGQQYDSENGFGASLGVGKEWWVSDHWGLGVAGRGLFSSNKDSSASNAPTWTTWGFGVLFSATYN